MEQHISMARKVGLGKGLDSLIVPGLLKDDTKKEKNRAANKNIAAVPAGNEGTEFTVNISQVEPNKEQPRKMFDEEALEELAASIKEHGVIQPLLVVKKDKHYEIVAGERRWRAAKMAGLKKIPVVVKELSHREIMEISLIENIQREDLNPIEEAQAYQSLLKEFDLTQEEIAQRVGKSRTAITNTMRLLKLDEAVQEMLINRQLSSGHARALLGLESSDEQYDLATQIIENHLSVRETEERVRQLNEPAQEVPPKEPALNDAVEEQKRLIYEEYEEVLKKVMRTKVHIKNSRKKDKGKIEIEYYSLEELERLLDMFQKLPEDSIS